MKILLLSAYDAASHKAWHKGLVQCLSEYSWTVLSLPARNFSWRIRGNSLTWAFNGELEGAAQYDCLVATSMVDLSALRGMCPALCQLPTLLYFHENQFFYPRSEDQHESLEPQIVQLYAALSADRLAFNSEHNRATFIDGVTALLKKMPDCIPKNIVSILEDKSCCLPVGLDVPSKSRPFSAGNRVSVLWNHRWEYDKGPERLLGVLQMLPADLPLCFHVVGQQFRVQPKEFDSIKTLLVERAWLGEWGFVDSREAYDQLLLKSDIVLSTAHHDFQGLSVLEAVLNGCIPVVPNALAYPQWIPALYRYEVDGNPAENISQLLLKYVNMKLENNEGWPKLDLSGLTWLCLKPEYEWVIKSMIRRA